MKKWLFALLVGFSCPFLVHADDLLDIYYQALDYDTEFKQAYSTYMADAQAIPIARSVLYPQITISGQLLHNIQKTHAGNVGVQESYNTGTWEINASQAVFNYQAWAQVQQAKASVKAAQALFNSAAQALILRTSNAYFDILFAQDEVTFAQAKKRANKRQLEQAQERFKVGLDAITSVYEAQAAYDQSVAQVISAKNNRTNQYENLRKLTNRLYTTLAPLKASGLPLVKPKPNNIDQWVAIALRQNYQLYAAKYSLEAARDNIKVQAAAGWPTVAIQSNTTQTYSTAGNSSIFVPSHQEISNIGLAFNFPVIQGGLVHAKTKQAQFDFQSSSELLERTYRDTIVNSRIAFNTIVDGISKVRADKQTIISTRNSLDSTQAQFDVGTRTMVDVVNAQERLFRAQTQLAQDQYGLIHAMLNLKFLAGTLTIKDIEHVNSWLATTRPSRFRTKKVTQSK